MIADYNAIYMSGYGELYQLLPREPLRAQRARSRRTRTPQRRQNAGRSTPAAAHKRKRNTAARMKRTSDRFRLHYYLVYALS